MMKVSKLSNQTNSQDPQAVNSRVFVGNLNTFQCSKTDVERMFQKYGRLAGISMHKGYAFVQFTNPFDARNACHGEDGRNILSQVLDVNMVAEPKAHQIGRKRQNITKTGNDWDYYYDSYYSSTIYSTTSPRPIKRQRLMIPQQTRDNLVVNAKMNSAQQQILLPGLMSNGNCLQTTNNTTNGCMNGEQIGGMYHLNGTAGIGGAGVGIGYQQQHLLGPFKVYSNPDTLICGNCRECFMDFRELLEHKRSYCKLRFACKCQETSTKNTLTTNTRLLCAICKESFSSPWDLMVHVQSAHMINIYDLGTDHTTTNGQENYNQTTNKIINSPKDVINGNTNHTAIHDVNTTNENATSNNTQIMVIDKDSSPQLSPISTVGKNIENSLLLSLSSTPLFSTNELKPENGSESPLSSSSDRSPRLEQISPNSTTACTIVAALSIETAPSSTSVSSIGHVPPPVIIGSI